MAERHYVAGSLVLPSGIQPGYLVVCGDSIDQVVLGADPPPEGPTRRSAYVLPGFVDIHNHGMGGSTELLRFWQNPDHTCRLLARSGVTSVLASLTFPEAGGDITQQTIAGLDAISGVYRSGCAVVEGIHAEGPVVADCGGLPPSDDAMQVDVFKSLVDSMKSLRVMTIAPSKDADGDYARIRYLLEKGVTPSLGHDRQCTESDIVGALRVTPAGRRLHITHLYNVMKFHHRDVSLINVGLAHQFPDDPLYEGLVPPTVEIINDGQHAAAMSVQLALRAREANDIAFITDCVGDASQRGSEYMYNGRAIVIDPTGTAVVKGTTTLAGSTATLWDVFQRTRRYNRVSLEDAVKMFSETPARVAGLQNVGTLEVGKKANIVLLDDGLETIVDVCIHGDWVLK